MTEKGSALYSHYIIDGVRCDMTPAELLDECMDDEGYVPGPGFEDIIDESTEPPLSSFTYAPEKEQEYIEITAAASHEERPFRMLYPEHFTKLQIARALLNRLWSKGHFKLGNLRLWAQWEWNTRPIGNMSAFYRSVESASGYIYGLGVKLEDYLFIEGDEGSNVKFFAWLDEQFDRSFADAQDDSEFAQDDESDIQAHHAERREASAAPEFLFKSSPFESRHPWISEDRQCPSVAAADPSSWLIYIPFDTCPFRLGGSLLTQLAGHDGGMAHEISDPDYFIDCYEVIRELVEDGIIISGATAADGGLAAALRNMCGDNGLDIDIKGIMSSYQEGARARILFGEVPGVIIQISDENYDYVDSQLLLQDIAYYPIGHPSASGRELNISETGKNGVSEILVSLLDHASEGED